jgi:hypothetical protein
MVSVLLRPIGGLITFTRLYMRSSLTWIAVRANVSLVFDIYLYTRAAHWRLWNCKDWNNILNWNEVVRQRSLVSRWAFIYIPQLPVNQGARDITDKKVCFQGFDSDPVDFSNHKFWQMRQSLWRSYVDPCRSLLLGLEKLPHRTAPCITAVSRPSALCERTRCLLVNSIV